MVCPWQRVRVVLYLATAVIAFRVLAGFAIDGTLGDKPSVSLGDGLRHGLADLNTTAVLVALHDGSDGDRILREWANYIRSKNSPPVWILCREKDAAYRQQLVQDLGPYVRAFAVEAGTPWAIILRDFGLQNENASVFGLLGEGAVPPDDLVQSISSLHQALDGSSEPTVVLSRSRSRDDLEWLPDTFISQVWCNRAMLDGVDLGGKEFVDSPLLEMLPTFVRGPDPVLADGTHCVPAIIDLRGEGRRSPLVGNATAVVDGENLYIGRSELALVHAEGGDGDGENEDAEGRVRIEEAPWPPAYVLKHVAAGSGLVLVNSVNCGYLDMATNFLLAARKVSDVKVLWVATDEIAFDFMDTLAPGCAALLPSARSNQRSAVKSGRYGDQIFKEQTQVRPDILLFILNQGYAVLWTDSDMVWLENPLPSLPDMHDPEAAEAMVQLDGSKQTPCTCLLFMKPTDMVKDLVLKWEQSIVDFDGAFDDQKPFRRPLYEQRDAGMRLEFFSMEAFPSGRHFFDYSYEENYAKIHFKRALVVHNNWITGHDSKRERFEEYHLWDVGDNTFPTCER